MELGLMAPEAGKWASGYGKNTLGIIQALIKNGITIDNAARVMLLIGFADWLEDESLDQQRIWLYTMSESTLVSKRWVDLINERAERVLVPCPSLVDVYKNSGVTRPIDFVGHGVDFSAPEYKPRGFYEGQPFHFLAYSAGGVDPRKGIEHVIYNFRRFNQMYPESMLTIKCSQKASETSWLDGYATDNIRVVKGYMSERRWHRMLHSAHCFVYPSYAEGWGMTPREAVLSGLPTIATEWLGMWDVARWGYPIQVRGFQPSVYDDYNKANGLGGLWAMPDDASILSRMISIREHYKEAQEATAIGHDYLIANWSYDVLGQRIKTLMDKHFAT